MQNINCVVLSSEEKFDEEKARLLNWYAGRTNCVTFEDFNTNLIVDSNEISLNMRTFDGDQSCSNIPKPYRWGQVDVMVVMFSLSNKQSLDKAEELLREIKKNYPNIPIFLVGTQSEQSNSVIQKQGEQAASRLGAKYMECSKAGTPTCKQELNDIFDNVISAAISSSWYSAILDEIKKLFLKLFVMIEEIQGGKSIITAPHPIEPAKKKPKPNPEEEITEEEIIGVFGAENLPGTIPEFNKRLTEVFSNTAQEHLNQSTSSTSSSHIPVIEQVTKEEAHELNPEEEIIGVFGAENLPGTIPEFNKRLTEVFSNTAQEHLNQSTSSTSSPHIPATEQVTKKASGLNQEEEITDVFYAEGPTPRKTTEEFKMGIEEIYLGALKKGLEERLVALTPKTTASQPSIQQQLQKTLAPISKKPSPAVSQQKTQLAQDNATQKKEKPVNEHEDGASFINT